MENAKHRVAVLVGSLRNDSLSLKMARCVQNLSSSRLDLHLISLNDLPLYNEDLETDQPPAGWQRFRQAIREQDAVLFITPEYNRSIPAVLKNAVDVGSAPHGRNVFAHKPAAIISLSPGKMGAFGANHHLRQCLVFLDMPTLQQPEVYLGGSEDLFAADGSIRAEHTRHYLSHFLSAFADWVNKHH